MEKREVNSLKLAVSVWPDLVWAAESRPKNYLGILSEPELDRGF